MLILIIVLIAILIYFLYRRQTKSRLINYRITITSRNTPNNIPLHTSNILFISHNDKFQLNNETLNYIDSVGVDSFMSKKDPNIRAKSQIPEGMTLPGTVSINMPIIPEEQYLSIYTKIKETNEIMILSNLHLKYNNKWINDAITPLYIPNYNQPIAYVEFFIKK